VRPIVNLARRPLHIGVRLSFLIASSLVRRTNRRLASVQHNGEVEVGQPINKILRGVFDVLTFESVSSTALSFSRDRVSSADSGQV